MDLALLDDRLAALGEPGFRARQVWRWTAHGAAGYEEMTDLPAALRARLAEEVPFSTLELVRERVREQLEVHADTVAPSARVPPGRGPPR